MPTLFRSIVAVLALCACDANVDVTKQATTPDDVADALAALPDAHVLVWRANGWPAYIVGELVKGNTLGDDPAAADAALRPSLAPVLAVFRLRSSDIALVGMHVDEAGTHRMRYAQIADVPVIGGDFVVAVDVKGAVMSITSNARGDLPELPASPISTTEAATLISRDARFAGLQQLATRHVYLRTADDTYRAYETTVTGTRGGEPVRDRVYVDVATGAIVAVYPQILAAEHREVYDARNGDVLPGMLVRAEGAAASSDLDVNGAYDNSGNAYDAYAAFFNRDSIDGAGMTIINTVHYQQNLCNAYFQAGELVIGDGNLAQSCQPLARSLDVVAHELTHAITASESGLVYASESGGINEAMSDIFGTFVSSWVKGGRSGVLAIDGATFHFASDVVPGGFRNMCDPVANGRAVDFYTPEVGTLDPHDSSGIANLAFCLLSVGGTHPRGRTAIDVPQIAMDRAVRLFYKANVDILTSTATYADLREATVVAAAELGYDQPTQDAVKCAWAAVGVGTAPDSCPGGVVAGNSSIPMLANDNPVTNLHDVQGGQKQFGIAIPPGTASLTITISGGTGDADLYVQSGNAPTKTAYACRPYKASTTETCTFPAPPATTFWIMLDAYKAYDGVTLTASFYDGGGDPMIAANAPIGLSGNEGDATYYRIAAPAGAPVTVSLSGGSGDADLYTRFGSRPTTTSYDCRPYLASTTEQCVRTNTTGSDYYIMVRGYRAFSGVMLSAAY